MQENSLNLYGDKPEFLTHGHGADIASQRADDLDLMAIEFAKSAAAMMALDVACGAGGQSIRLAEQGVDVLALDVANMAPIIKPLIANLPGKVVFFQYDMRYLDYICANGFDIIICQRAIHYLPFAEAVSVVTEMQNLLSPGGRVYLSASGIYSELGDGYSAREDVLKDRYAELSPTMRDKHDIHGKVCLYSEADLTALLHAGGLVPEKIFSSKFGNIKAVARHV